MSKLARAIYEVHSMDTLASGDSPIHRLHPLAKLLVTIAYIGFVVSFHPKDVAGLITMMIYPALLFPISGTSFLHGLKKLRLVLPILVLMGLFNVFLNRTPLFMIDDLKVTEGMVTGLTLILKGFFSVWASYLLIATTTIESICHALQILHLPDILVTQTLLTYRYVTVLLTEANHLYEAYSLRAPGQKGIHSKIWGSLLGQLFFRSLDRASALYDAMVLRGFNGTFRYTPVEVHRGRDPWYLIGWCILFLLLRFVRVSEWIGTMFI